MSSRTIKTLEEQFEERINKAKNHVNDFNRARMQNPHSEQVKAMLLDMHLIIFSLKHDVISFKGKPAVFERFRELILHIEAQGASSPVRSRNKPG